jgi:hypothetical protein
MCVFIALAIMAVLTWFFAEAWRFAVGVGTVWLLVLLSVTSLVMLASHGYCFYLIFSSRIQVCTYTIERYCKFLIHLDVVLCNVHTALVSAVSIAVQALVLTYACSVERHSHMVCAA